MSVSLSYEIADADADIDVLAGSPKYMYDSPSDTFDLSASNDVDSANTGDDPNFT